MTLDQISAELYEKNQELMQDSHYKIVRDFYCTKVTEIDFLIPNSTFRI